MLEKEKEKKETGNKCYPFTNQYLNIYIVLKIYIKFLDSDLFPVANGAMTHRSDLTYMFVSQNPKYIVDYKLTFVWVRKKLNI